MDRNKTSLRSIAASYLRRYMCLISTVNKIK